MTEQSFADQKAVSERKRLPMTGWYNPVTLVRTGIRVAVSTVFGEFADRREAMAAANAIAAQPFEAGFDYSDRMKGNEIWIDFLADTGDGWDSTFAMAQLITEPGLDIAGTSLARGHLQILGGDQVYPTASREAYDIRFLGPFDEAFEQVAPSPDGPMPDLYAIPGNHDWYDGLGAFFTIFCRRRIAPKGMLGIDRPGRIIAGRATNQTRSYFAVKLPHDWWIWGTDSQLKGHIDQPQIDYFQWVAEHWMEPESKLILCVGQPNWAYVDDHDPAPEFETFSYLERLVGLARKGHQLKLVLTGDSHHYSRYVSGDVQYVTSGGGGAFLHPTHQLENKQFDWEYPMPGLDYDRAAGPYPRTFTIAQKSKGGKEALYPDRETSRGLTRHNLGFAFHNPGMVLVFGVAYLIFNWLMDVNARTTGHGSLVQALNEVTFSSSLLSYVKLLFASPWSFILMAAAFGGYYYFAGGRHGPKRVWIGFTHWAAQTLAAVLVTCVVVRLVGELSRRFGWLEAMQNVTALGTGSLVAAFGSATIFGVYLWVSLNGFGRHWNEAFSSLAIKDYKNFLRMKIDGKGELHLYPIGLETVPEGGGTPRTLKPHLIEGPIIIS